jgi:PAS domain S-box-containing protein
MKKNAENQEDIKKSGETNQEIIGWKQRFELVAEASGQIVYDYNVNTGSIIWSGSIEKVLGYKLTEMTGGIKQWEKLIHRDDRKEALRLLKIAEKDLAPYEVEYRYKHKNGNYLIIKDHGFFIPDDKGKSKHLVGMMQDISTQKRSKQLITALNTAAVEMQKVFSKEELFKVVARALKKMNIESMVSIVDDEKKNLYFKYFSYDSKLIKVAEKIAGMSAIDLSIPINKHREYEDVIFHKKTLLMNSSVDFIRKILPQKVKFMAGQVTKMFNISRFIIAPLIVDDRVFGTFSVQASDLLESDIPAVTVFAHQLAGAWYKGELIEKVQRDIKEREYAELALKESELKSRTLIEQLSEGIALIDDKGKIIEWNDSMEKITGRKRENALNLYFWEMQYEHLLPERRNSERYKQLNNMLVGALKKKDSEVFNKTFEMPIVHLNGEIRIIESTIFPIFLGEKFFVGNVSRDITEQKKTETVLHEREELFRKIFDESSIGMVMSDEKSNFTRVNEMSCKMLGYTEEELKSKTYLDITHPDYKELDYEIEIVRKIKTGELQQYKTEKPYLKKNKEIFWGSLTLSAIRNNEGVFKYFLALIEDITERKEAERKIDESNRKLNTLINNLTGVVYRCQNDKNWTMEFVSNGILELTGYPPEDFIFNKVRTFDSVIDSEDRMLIWDLIQVAIEKKESYTLEYRINCANGEQKWVWEKGRGIFEGDRLIALEGYISDETMQRDAAQALKDSEETLKTFINALPEPAFLIDKNYNFLLSNKSLAKDFNLSPEKIVGKNIYDILPKVDADRRAKVIDKVLKTEEPVIFEDSRDGLYYINYLFPVFDEGKKVSKVAIFALDITSRLKAEKQNLLLAQTLKSVKDAVSITDLNNNVIFVNDAFLDTYGYMESEVFGRNISILNLKEAGKVSTGIHEKTIEGGYHGELINIRKDGSEFPIELWTSTVRDANNNIIATVGVARDITERKQAEEELFEKTKELDRYFTSSLDLLCIADTDGHFRRLNPEWERILGYSRDELFERKFIDFVHPDDYESTLEAIKILSNQKEVVNFVNRYKCKDGSYKWLEWRSYPEGNLIYAVARDITSRLKAEKENTLLAQTIKSVKDSITITDMNNNILFVNDAFLETYGYKKDEVIGRNISFVVSEKENENTVSMVFDGTVNGNWNGELINLRKDGTEFPIELWTSIVKDANDNNVAMVGVARDITERKQAEKEIDEANKKLIRAQRVARIGSWEDYLPTGELFWSDEMYNIFGIEKGKKIGLSETLKLISPEEIERLQSAINEAIVNRKPYSVDYKIITAGGNVKYIHDEGEVKYDENGNAVWMYGTTQDITENKLAEIAIKENEEKMQSIFRVAPAGIGILRDRIFLDVNLQIYEMTGYSKDELIGKSARILYPTDEDFEFVGTEKYRQIREKGTGLVETRWRKKNGEIINIILSSTPIDRNDSFKGVIFTALDITKRMQAEENLRKSEERFKQVAESADEWIWEVNADGLYTYASPVVEKILGYTSEEIVNKKHFYDFFSPEIKDGLKKTALEVFNRKEKIKGLINKNVHRNGNVITLETSGVPILDKKNKLLGYRGVDTDITERKRAEEELIKAKEKAEEMNRVKTSFLANMSHEVRTPLVAILGFSEVLGEIIKDEELKNFVDMIHKGGERLLDTLNLILDLSVIEAQKIKIELVPLDIVDETRQVINLFEKTAKKKKLAISTDFEFESFIINLDIKILRQITNNLINNAIKYTNSGEIIVKLNKEKKEKGSYLVLRVEDTGIGIPEDKQNLIWEEFRQVSEGLNRSFEGTGLGLSITQKFVEKLGGEIYLEKSEVDVGSVFTVLFPIDDIRSKDSSQNIKHEIKKEIEKHQFPEILYVEDDPIAVDIVKTFIKDSYAVEIATSGKEGVEKAKAKIYSAILMDINLGRDMDGLEATKIIRTISGYKNVPIVAITAFAMVGDKEEFFEKGCTHYLSKPFTKKEFRELISEILPVKK